MSSRLLFLFSLVCCAVCCAPADGAYARMLITDVPLNRTAAWEKHVAMLRENPSPKAVPPFRVAVGAPAPAAALSNITVPLEWHPRIRRASNRHGVPEALLAAVLKVESNFNAWAVSPKGARGAMQIMPETGRAFGLQNFFDPEANLDVGAHYLASLLQEFSRPELALAAYNAGPDAVRRYGGLPPYEETRAYVARVLALCNRYNTKNR